MEDGGWKMEDGGWKMEDGGWKMEDGELILKPRLDFPFSISHFSFVIGSEA